MTADPPGRPRRVLFVSSAGSLYGGEISLLHIVRRLDPAQWVPAFVVPGEAAFAEAIRAEGWPVTICKVTDGQGSLRGKLGTARDLVRVIRASQADLVHLNLHFSWPAVSFGCLIARVPLVIHVRNMIPPRRVGALDRLLFRRAQACICISEAVRDSIVQARLADSRRIRVIADARDLSALVQGNRARFRHELGIPPEAPLIGMIARFEPMKGQDIFLTAARLVAARLPGARFILAGGVMRESDRPYLAELERLAADPVLAGRVTILGYRQDVPDLLAALDCFVHSSRRGAFVSVLIEAMAAGIPIVASDVDGIPECVGRDGAAELVIPTDTAGFADAIVRVVTDPARAEAMRRGGLERTSRLFDAAPLARATAEVFTAACGGGVISAGQRVPG